RDAPMTKSVEPRRRELQLLENLIQLAPHVAFAKRCSVASLKRSTGFTLSHVCGQHLGQSRFDSDPAIALLCLDRNFFAIPDATAHVDSVAEKVQVFNV